MKFYNLGDKTFETDFRAISQNLALLSAVSVLIVLLKVVRLIITVCSTDARGLTVKY